MSMDRLEGKVCVVTGGASGIGLALARRFQTAGMSVAVGDVEVGALAGAVESLGGDVLGVRCDVTRRDDMHALRDAVVDRFGGAHVVCLNAGVAAIGPIIGTSLDTWRWLLDVNVLGVVHGIEAFGPGLVAQGDGHFLLTASSSGLATSPGLGAYGATKHAVVGTAAVLREELRTAGVGVTVLCPGLVRTRILESERNRAAGAAETHADPAMAAWLRASVDNDGADPAAIADAAHAAVLREELFVVTSDVHAMVGARLDEVHAALEEKS
jgi:NAD(P)-dependent dehydrogenase (short-subunit alcohol dehydrogenase family)